MAVSLLRPMGHVSDIQGPFLSLLRPMGHVSDIRGPFLSLLRPMGHVSDTRGPLLSLLCPEGHVSDTQKSRPVAVWPAREFLTCHHVPEESSRAYSHGIIRLMKRNERQIMTTTPSTGRGVVYGVGVGPGDPELLTLKAVRTIRACPVIAVPGNVVTESLAYRIALPAVPELAEKELVPLPSPMVRNRAQVMDAHAKNATTIERYLDQGKDVACLVLGDPSIYCTFGYLRQALEADGYETVTVAGVPSFCAAAARLGSTLVEGDRPLHLTVASTLSSPDDLPTSATHVIMKAGGHMHEVKPLLEEAGLEAQAVERCDLEGEQVYPSLEVIPDDAGYLTLIIART